MSNPPRRVNSLASSRPSLGSSTCISSNVGHGPPSTALNDLTRTSYFCGTSPPLHTSQVEAAGCRWILVAPKLLLNQACEINHPGNLCPHIIPSFFLRESNPSSFTMHSFFFLLISHLFHIDARFYVGVMLILTSVWCCLATTMSIVISFAESK